MTLSRALLFDGPLRLRTAPPGGWTAMTVAFSRSG